VFESKKINPVVKKMFDPSFKKKYQEENDLRALHGCNDTRGENVRADAGRAAALGVSEDVARRTNAGADATSLQTGIHPQIAARSCVLIATALNTTLMISNALRWRQSLAQLFKSVLILQRATKASIKCATPCVNFISCAMRRKRISASWALKPIRQTWRKVLASTRVTGGMTTRRRGLLLGQ